MPPPLVGLFEDGDTLGRVMGSGPSAVDEKGWYRHWDTLRHVRPPEGLSSEEWWWATKLARSLIRHSLPLLDSKGVPLTYSMPDPAYRMIHEVDRQASGMIAVDEAVTNPAIRDRYIVNSLIEESITSSQLEGALTTRAVAKEMIRSGRAPRDKSELMVMNNYRAMTAIGRFVNEPLSPSLVCELHAILTEGTLDDPDDAGRPQRPDEDRVQVVDDRKEVIYTPPPATQLEERMQAMCDFANEVESPTGFLHPVVRSILLHFWLAYDHPFVDGNGRTARALFYWSMLRQGYWLTEFISISRILRKAPARYGKSFLYVETDDGDTTYFVLSQLRVLQRAIDDLREHLMRKMRELREVERSLRASVDFNHRQLAVLGHALRHPDAIYTYRSHATSHRVVHQSARTDLLGLHGAGLLDKRRIGRADHFFPVVDLSERLRLAS